MKALYGEMKEVKGGQVMQGLASSIKHFGLHLKRADMIKFVLLLFCFFNSIVIASYFEFFFPPFKFVFNII